jgi:Zn-dependent peptidase ImmA (M78 family)
MLSWAREESRVDVATAARRVGKGPAEIEAWERGETIPTLNQARTLASLYKRSVGVFFLKEKPKSGKRPGDFRRLELSAQGAMSPALADGIREADAKRDAALELFRQLEQQPPAWSLKIADRAPPEVAAETISALLGADLRLRSGWRTQYEALSGWRSAVEGMGALVVQVSRVSMHEMRGCSLATFPLPVIILNGADSPLGRVFTLLHEVTHLARSESGLCDISEGAERTQAIEALEAYCNHVAGATLVPAAQLLARPEVRAANEKSEWTPEQLSALSRAFWASREVVLRRLLTLRKTSQDFYQVMRQRFEQEYAEMRDREEDAYVPYYRKVLLSNGRFLSRLAIDAYTAEAITGTQLSRILNAKLDHLPKLREALGEVIA